MTSKILVHCSFCDENIDITGQTFCDCDEMPIVLDLQLKGNSTERRAINFAIKHHGITKEDYVGDDGKIHMYRHELSKVSHKDYDAENADNHYLDYSSHWSFQ